MDLTPKPILRRGLERMHGLLDKAIDEMTVEQLNFRPAEGGVTAFFSLWHYVRTEDNIVQWAVQKRPTVWTEGGFPERLRLPPTSQGTGMTDEQARAVVLRSLPDWLEYQRLVWQATETFIAEIDPAEFQEPVVIKPAPPMTVWDGVFGMCMTHGFRHVGEIEYARGVQGLSGLTI